MTADDKDSLLNREKLLQHFQMQLSQKKKRFPQFFFFFSFPKFALNFEHFLKKDVPHSSRIFKLTNSKICD